MSDGVVHSVGDKSAGLNTRQGPATIPDLPWAWIGLDISDHLRADDDTLAVPGKLPSTSQWTSSVANDRDRFVVTLTITSVWGPQLGAIESVDLGNRLAGFTPATTKSVSAEFSGHSSDNDDAVPAAGLGLVHG
jgi:hypothetical protein